MSEYLVFNSGGQWDLHKSTGEGIKEPKSDYKPGSATYAARSGSSLTGDLPKDTGQKGSLKDFGGGDVPKSVDIKQVVKPARQMQSLFTARNPGAGD